MRKYFKTLRVQDKLENGPQKTSLTSGVCCSQGTRNQRESLKNPLEKNTT